MNWNGKMTKKIRSRLKKMKNLNGISTTSVVYNPKLGGVRDKFVGDTDISGFLVNGV